MTTDWVSGRSASSKLRPRTISTPAASKNPGSTSARSAMKAPWSVGGSNPSTLKSLDLWLSGFRCRLLTAPTASSVTGVGSGRSAGGQQVEQPDRQPDAGAPRQQAQQRRLGQETPHERPARRAQRKAHRDLPAPVEGEREQEAGEVGARQQQHQPDDHHQQPRRRPDEDVQRREDQHVGERQEHELPGWIPVLHAVPSELRGYRPDDRLGLGQRDAWPETCLGEERGVAPNVEQRESVQLLGHHERDVERRRQAADGAREVGRPYPITCTRGRRRASGGRRRPGRRRMRSASIDGRASRPDARRARRRRSAAGCVRPPPRFPASGSSCR